jgi:hypothetical protein
MAMKPPMSLDKAKHIAHVATLGRAKYGPQFSPPYSQADLVEALSVLNEFGNWDGPSKEQLTKVNRQLAACNARQARGEIARDKTKLEAAYAGEDETPGL